MIPGYFLLPNGNMMVQLGAGSKIVYKETKWNGSGWAFVDFHRSLPQGVRRVGEI